MRWEDRNHAWRLYEEARNLWLRIPWVAPYFTAAKFLGSRAARDEMHHRFHEGDHGVNMGEFQMAAMTSLLPGGSSFLAGNGMERMKEPWTCRKLLGSCGQHGPSTWICPGEHPGHEAFSTETRMGVCASG